MKRVNQWIMLALMGSLIGWSTACSDDDEVPNDGLAEARYVSLGIISGETSYILPTNSPMEDTISPVGNGVEFGGRAFLASGNYLYDFNERNKNFEQYELMPDGNVEEVASILATQYVSDRAFSRNIIDDNTLLVMDPVVWGEPATKWVMISLPDFVVTSSGTFDLPTLEQAPGVNYQINVGKGVRHSDKFIMGTVFYSNEGEFAEGSHAVVLDYPSMTNPTLIGTDLINGELGIISSANFAQTENGDLYITASGGASLTKPGKDGQYGGILRIKSGETDFDESYLLDLTQATGTPTNIMHLNYIGNNIAIAQLFNPREVNWGNLDGDHYTFAKINLATQEVTPYNLPPSGSRLAREPLIADGQYYTFLKKAAESTTHVLRLDPQGGPDDYEIGALIEGDNVQGYSIALHPAPTQ